MAAKGGHWKGGRFVRAAGAARGGGVGGGAKAVVQAYRKLSRGLRDSDVEYIRDPRSFRRGSFRAVRRAYNGYAKQGFSVHQIATQKMDPVRFNVQPDGSIHVNDGRHRLAWARHKGAKAVRARVVVYGPRGGVKSDRVMTVPLK